MTREEKSPIEIGKAPRITKRVRFEMEMPPEDQERLPTKETETPKADGILPTKMEKSPVRMSELTKVVVSTKK